MKNQILKAIGGLSLAILVLTVFAQVRVSAQDNDNELLQNGNGANKRSLVGSWNLQVTLRDCDSGFPFVTFPAINTYNQGGTMLQTATPEPGVTSLPGHGVWEERQNGRQYSAAFQFFALNPDPTLTRRVVVRSAISLSKDGNSYTSTDAAEIFNLNGDLLDRSCSTTTATRFE